jgi:hypothetical protein
MGGFFPAAVRERKEDEETKGNGARSSEFRSDPRATIR